MFPFLWRVYHLPQVRLEDWALLPSRQHWDKLYEQDILWARFHHDCRKQWESWIQSLSEVGADLGRTQYQEIHIFLVQVKELKYSWILSNMKKITTMPSLSSIKLHSLPLSRIYPCALIHHLQHLLTVWSLMPQKTIFVPSFIWALFNQYRAETMMIARSHCLIIWEGGSGRLLTSTTSMVFYVFCAIGIAAWHFPFLGWWFTTWVCFRIVSELVSKLQLKTACPSKVPFAVYFYWSKMV